jgi:hypothetical protein
MIHWCVIDIKHEAKEHPIETHLTEYAKSRKRFERYTALTNYADFTGWIDGAPGEIVRHIH